MNIVEELRNKKSRDNRELLDRAADRIEELELLLNQNKSNNFDVKSNNEIEEMANDYYEAMLKARGTLGSMNEGAPKWYAKELYDKGYRKQSEGEWELVECQSGLFSIDQYFVCSACKQEFVVEGWDYEDLVANAKYCPNCGAKMKGE